ncbi:MAG TPA: Crp/Fnr family transcriptional regulator [Puia sp.]|nr:Crp/Fnr family transcriptional regulator [Puia sp.]
MKSQKKSPYKEALEKLWHYLSGFVPLSRTEFQLILPYLEIREFEKKGMVVKPGEVDKYINLIVQGLARKYLPVKDGDITLQLATEGHIVHSELSFHTQAPSGPGIETIEPTVFISISFDSLQQLYEQVPKAERLGRLLMSDLFIRKDSRYFDQLQKSTRERFLEYIRTHPHILQRVPQKYIASYLNIKPETFSRLKHLLQPRRGGGAPSQIHDKHRDL